MILEVSEDVGLEPVVREVGEVGEVERAVGEVFARVRVDIVD